MSRLRTLGAAIAISGLAYSMQACSPAAPIAVPPTPSASAAGASSAAPDAGVAATQVRDATSVGAGAHHACARLASGLVVCWGANDRGQLGLADPTPSALAVPVPGVEHAAELAVSPGDFACARHNDGGVSCWGHGLAKATRIAGVSGAIQIAAGDGAAACAVLEDTTIRCWTMDSVVAAATDPAPGLRDVEQIAVASDHSCARLKGGALRCWGDNCAGQLGDGSRERRPTPVAVVDLPRALAVAVSPSRSCALLPSHALACWGSAGWSCDAAIPDRCVPAGSAGGCGDIAATHPHVARGVTHVAALPEGRLGCVVLERGEVACWDGRREAPEFPGTAGPVAGVGGVVGMSSGERHACAVLGYGTVLCWGEDEAGQLGNGALKQASAVPVPVLQR